MEKKKANEDEEAEEKERKKGSKGVRSTSRNGEARGWSSGRRRPPRGRAAFSPVSASSGSSAASAPPVSREPELHNIILSLRSSLLMMNFMRILCS